MLPTTNTFPTTKQVYVWLWACIHAMLTVCLEVAAYMQIATMYLN